MAPASRHGTRKGCHYYTTLGAPLPVYSSDRACPCHARLPCHTPSSARVQRVDRRAVYSSDRACPCHANMPCHAHHLHSDATTTLTGLGAQFCIPGVPLLPVQPCRLSARTASIERLSRWRTRALRSCVNAALGAG